MPCVDSSTVSKGRDTGANSTEDGHGQSGSEYDSDSDDMSDLVANMNHRTFAEEEDEETESEDEG